LEALMTDVAILRGRQLELGQKVQGEAFLAKFPASTELVLATISCIHTPSAYVTTSATAPVSVVKEGNNLVAKNITNECLVCAEPEAMHAYIDLLSWNTIDREAKSDAQIIGWDDILPTLPSIKPLGVKALTARPVSMLGNRL
jgi:hypothetical protein